jgi:hypothetical protein
MSDEVMGCHQHVLRLYLAVILFAANQGCLDEACRSAEQRCDGQSAMSCQTRSCHGCLFSAPDNHWVSQGCPAACVEHADQAFCALSTEPDARCLASSSQIFCDAAALLSCRGQFLTSVQECDLACVAPRPGVAFCAASPDPDPGCESDASAPSMMCSGNAIERCSESYAECVPRFPFGDRDEDAGTL